jgi:hypothetical protein
MELPQLRYDFPVISDGKRFVNDRDLSSADPGERILSEETLFRAGEGRFEKGPEVGVLVLDHVVTMRPGLTRATATFVFDDGDEVTFAGVVPGNGSWNGTGRFGFVSGTGKFEFPRRNLPVDAQNPKRWG